MTLDNVTLEEVEAMQQRLAGCFKEYAKRCAESGDLNGYAAFDMASQFVLAEPVRRCYSTQNDTRRTSDSAVQDSEPEMDFVCSGV